MPERFAHGYQTLVDETETSYQVGEFYTPEREGGLLYDDPRSGSSWPLPVAAISDEGRRSGSGLDEVEARDLSACRDGGGTR